MADDGIRKKIFQNVEATLKEVESLRNVSFGSYELYGEQRPRAGILPDEEATDTEPDDIYIERLRFAIRIVVDETDQMAGYQLEDILRDAHTALLADPKRGDLAENTVKVGVKWLFLDQQYPRAGADLNMMVTYTTEEKDPTVYTGIP